MAKYKIYGNYVFSKYFGEVEAVRWRIMYC